MPDFPNVLTNALDKYAAKENSDEEARVQREREREMAWDEHGKWVSIFQNQSDSHYRGDGGKQGAFQQRRKRLYEEWLEGYLTNGGTPFTHDDWGIMRPYECAFGNHNSASNGVDFWIIAQEGLIIEPNLYDSTPFCILVPGGVRVQVDEGNYGRHYPAIYFLDGFRLVGASYAPLYGDLVLFGKPVKKGADA